MNALSLQGLCVGHKHHRLLTDLTRDIASGTLTLLVGDNGSGKSTLLRTLAGLLPPMRGHILWYGCDLQRMSADERAHTLSVVWTDQPRHLTLSGHDLVAMGRMPYTPMNGRLSAEDNEVCKCAMLRCGVAHLATRSVATLSDGERQRLMIARALTQDTPALLLDEPTAFLDHRGKAQTYDLLCALAHEEGKTIVAATHDIEVATPRADAVWHLP